MGAAANRPGRAEALPESARLVATVGRPHGVRGELRLFPVSGRPERLSGVRELWLTSSREPGASPRRFAVASVRVHGRAALAVVEGVDQREDAAAFAGWDVHARAEELPPWGPDEFGLAEVLGAVLHDRDRRVGEVVGLVEISGRDYFELLHEGRRVLVPAVKAWLVELDLESGRIVMELPEGLLEAQAAGPEGGTP